MLVLTRYPTESVVLNLPDGEQVRVVAVSVDGRKVCLGFDATDPRITIVQDELVGYEIPSTGRKEAVSTGGPPDDTRPREVS